MRTAKRSGAGYEVRYRVGIAHQYHWGRRCPIHITPSARASNGNGGLYARRRGSKCDLRPRARRSGDMEIGGRAPNGNA